MPRALAFVLLVAALSLLPGAPSASAAVAKFSASLSGTYTTSGTETDSNCSVPTPNGEDEAVPVTQHGKASERDSFRSLAPVALTVSRVRGQHTFDAGSFARLRTAFDIARTSTADPPYCHASDAGFLHPDCGSLRRTYSLWVYGRTDRPAFSFMFSRGDSPYHPEDPFSECRLFGGRWIGYLENSGAAPVPAARLFNRRSGRIVVHGGTGGSLHETNGEEKGTYKLAWTLTLKRR
jgi:hypothetical protein